MTRLVLFSALCSLACAPTDGAPDASETVDAGPVDVGDTTDTTDAGSADAGPVTGLTLNASAGGTFPFDVAAGGITFGNESTPDTLYAEAWSGGFTGCPAQDSPTPDRILIFSGISLAGDAPGTQTQLDGVVMNLLDFKGDIADSPAPQRASSVAITNLVVAGCPDEGDCAGPFEFDVAATLPQGIVVGHVVAPRCASMDE